MYKNKKILAFIPARAGSKRIIGKNKKELNGKPLFTYSVDIAKKSKYIDDILVSTDSEEILELAHKLGCKKNGLRPKELSGDHARIVDAILYEVKENKLDDYDAVVLLQPTFPIRTVEMLEGAIEEYMKEETSLITVVKAEEQPLFMRTIQDGKLEKILKVTSDVRSQDFPMVYKIIGCIYINNLHTLTTNSVLNENEVPYIINKKYDIDIDTIEDFYRAEREIKK